MKKALLLSLLLCGLGMAQAQNAIQFVCNGSTYAAGDTIDLRVDKNAFATRDVIEISATEAVTGAVIQLATVAENGFRVSGMCTSRCVEGQTSAAFDIPAAPGHFDDLSFDLAWDAAADNSSYCVYDLTVGGQAFVLRIAVKGAVGIADVRSAARVAAYPNPAEGEVNIRYAVEQEAVLAIVDAQGRTVRQQPVSGCGTLRVSGLPAGIYAFGIKAAGQRAVMQKVVVR